MTVSQTSAEPTERPELPSADPRRRSRRRTGRVALGTLGACIGAVLVMVVPQLAFGAGVISHEACGRGPEVSSEEDRWIPSALLNTPYGGSGFGEGFVDWTGPLKHEVGVGARGGNSSGAFATENATLYGQENVTRPGPGINHPCTRGYVVEISPPLTQDGGPWPIEAPSNLSDIGEATEVAVLGETSNISAEVFISNGFTESNAPSISTCFESSPVTREVHVAELTVRVPFNASGRTLAEPVTLSEPENYTYEFPSGFGTWEVDNLSMPGGPGGGWAFSFAPCV